MALGEAEDNLELVEDMSINQGNIAKQKKRELVGSVIDGGERKHGFGKEGRSFCYPKGRSTHFIPILLTSPETQKAAKHFQEAVSSDFAPFCVPRATLHVTLCLLHLDTPEETHKAMMAQEELQTGFQRLLPSSCFSPSVLYLAPDPVPQLGALAQSLEDAFTKKGLTVICPPSKGKFHLTAVKVHPRKGMPQLLSGLAWAATMEDLGVQAVESIGLYEVGKGKRTDQ
ncbi:hypothetical protein E2320_022714, partial [Naja naja]